MSRPGLERSIPAYLRLIEKSMRPHTPHGDGGESTSKIFGSGLDGLDFLRSAELVRREKQFSIGMCSSQKYRVAWSCSHVI